MGRSSVLALLLFAGCGHGTSGGDGGHPADLSAARDFSAQTEADLAVAPADLAVAADLATPADLAAPEDLTAPPNGMVTASLSDVMIFENCMPIVAPDPVSISATITITNTGNVPIGPVTVGSGEVVQNMNVLISWKAQPVQTGVIQPGQSAMLQIAKTANSAMPAKACATLPCNGGVNLSVPYTGPGVPNGNRAVSGLNFVTCAF
jgi:hypothetical protein